MNRMPSLNTIIAIIAVLVMIWCSPAFGGGIDSGIARAVAHFPIALGGWPSFRQACPMPRTMRVERAKAEEQRVK